MPSRRKRKPVSQVKQKEQSDEKPPLTKVNKRQKTGKSQGSSLLVKIKQEDEDAPRTSRDIDLTPVTISPPQANQGEGSLKMKFILSPKKEPEDDEEDEDLVNTELVPSWPKGMVVESPSKKRSSLKLKFSYKTPPEESTNEKSKPPKKKKGKHDVKVLEESPIHPKKRFKSTFEEGVNIDLLEPIIVPAGPSKKKSKTRKLDSDSGYSDAQTSALASSKFKPANSPLPEILNDKKEKKKKRKEKDRKKKLFKNKSDKNRFLNVHRSSDETEDGWIEEKDMPVVPKTEPLDNIDYVVASIKKEPIDIEIPSSPVIKGEVRYHMLKPIKLKKDKKRSKNKSKRRHSKKSKRWLHHMEKKKKDKVSFTQEEIKKIQQRLMLQGLKSPSSGGDDLSALNFSSHGEDLISQLTGSSGHFDPSSLLDEPPIIQPPRRRPIGSNLLKKGDKDKLKDKQQQKKKGRVPTAYQMWCKANRASILKKHPGLDFGTMSKQLALLWHSLPEKEKTKWLHKQRALLLRHKNVPALSRMKKKQAARGNSAKARSQQYKAPPPHTDPIDVAAHLKLLGESLGNVGKSLMEQAGGEAEVHGSVSVLMDSMLSAIAPLMCLTSQVEELDVIPRKKQSSLLENIAYIMPGL